MFIEVIKSLIIFSSIIVFMFPIYKGVKEKHLDQITLHKKIKKCFMEGVCKDSSVITYNNEKVYIKKPHKGLYEERRIKNEKFDEFFKKVSKTVKDNSK